MRLLFDSFWRALAYTLHARVMAYSLLPLALMVVLGLGWGYYFWEPSVGWVRDTVVTWAWVQLVLGWLHLQGTPDLFAPIDGYTLHADFSADVTTPASRDALVALVEGYGLTEASPVVTTGLVKNGDVLTPRGSIGVPLRDVEVRLVDEDGDDVARCCSITKRNKFSVCSAAILDKVSC